MKIKLILSTFVILLFIFNISHSQPILNVIYPDGVENLNYNVPINITWQSLNIDGNIDIYLWNGSSRTYSLVASDVSSTLTSYNWTPGPESIGENCRIKIVYYDSIIVTDISETYFDIIIEQQNSGTVIKETDSYDTNIKLYPNPVKETLLIQWEFKIIPVLISVIDISGKEYLRTSDFDKSNQKTINVSNFPSGCYFVKIYLDKGFIVSKKVIII
jgi:hypothetical protein